MTLVIVIIVALIGYLAWRGARERVREARDALRRTRSADSRAVTLEKDPATGVYRERRRARDDD